jgi:hypothetical protein
MLFCELIFLLFFQVVLVIIVRYRIIENYERNIINLVLSKLDYCPKHYKIIKKNNKIFIKCHYYTTDLSHFIISSYIVNYIQYNSFGYYLKVYGNNQLKKRLLNNYAIGKDIGINVIDILIDLKDKKYKIVNSYFQIVNSIIDTNNLYFKIINYLNDPTFYINVNDIYDNDLNINDTIPNYLYHPFYQQLANKEKRYRCNYCKKFNITITNNIISLNINPILIQIGKHPNNIMEVSNDIDYKPHINNHISINKISGLLI